jgi:hypothetical protein
MLSAAKSRISGLNAERPACGDELNSAFIIQHSAFLRKIPFRLRHYIGMYLGVAITRWRVAPLAMCLVVLCTQYSLAQTRGDQDAAALYRRAWESITVLSPVNSGLVSPEFPPYSPDWQKMAKAAYEANLQAYELVHRASSIDFTDWPKSNDPERAYIEPLRFLANAVADAAAYLDLRGEDGPAIEKIEDLLHLADLLDRHPNSPLIQILLASGIREITTYRLFVISSNIYLTTDPSNQRDAQVTAVRELINELLNVPGPREEFAVMPASDRMWWDGAAQRHEVGYEHMIEFLKRRGDCDLAAMSLACHLFLFEHHRWPDSLAELIPADLPHAIIDPWGDDKQTLGYALIKSGLPDGSDRPLVYSRCRSSNGLFFRTDLPMYSFYTAYGLPARFHNGGQFRDVARWTPKSQTLATRPIP